MFSFQISFFIFILEENTDEKDFSFSYIFVLLGLKLIVQISTRMLEIMIHIIAYNISICQLNTAFFTNTIIIISLSFPLFCQFSHIKHG